MTLEYGLQYSQAVLRQVARPGDWAVDATAGNGVDTLFLARLTRPGGRVFACDIQAAALESTRVRLEAEGALADCVLLHLGHERLATQLPPEGKGRIAAIMFNLGWLPHGDKTIVTRPETTVAALESLLPWLRPGGVLSAFCYLGHEGGAAEHEAVRAWCRGLDWRRWRALSHGFENEPANVTRLYLVEARKNSDLSRRNG